MDVDDQGDEQNATLRGHSLVDMPEEILEIIQLRESPQFLNALGVAALKPALTLKLFSRFEAVFADTCSKWISESGGKIQKNGIIEAFARILPLAPQLSTYLEKYLSETNPPSGPENRLQSPKILSLNGGGHWGITELSIHQLQLILLAAFRLLNFNKETFCRSISGSKVQTFFQHGDPSIRYLAVRIFCQLCSASDSKLEAMIDEHVGKNTAIMGDFDGDLVDYGFLSLLECKRLEDAQKLRMLPNAGFAPGLQSLNLEGLSSLVVQHKNILLPRPSGPPTLPSALVDTETTSNNMEAFAKSLLSPSPIILHGLAGSGKTSLVNDFARELRVDSKMVTLHLNEQTDAKMLIGMYATGSTPGSFTWRQGVLATAVREGRWVFIEDLDRAPNEVISVVLPLIERGELLIPSRGETIKASRGFRLLASIRTSLNVAGQENSPAMHMLGSRLWQRVPIQMPSQDEFREIIDGKHPILHQFLPGVISVYERLYALSHKPSFASSSRISLGRPISPRDLLKWCRRLENVLHSSGSETGKEPISDATKYEMFLEAVDCFTGSLQTEESRRSAISCIAEEMHIDPQRVDHFLTSHIPRYHDNDTELRIGRARLSKRKTSRVIKTTKKARPFANTTHAKRLLEQVGVAVRMSEPVLLVGETGIGKTTVVQQLADCLGYRLTAVNLSQQSEVGDLLGGFKPVNVRSLAIPLKDEFDALFASTGISATKNQRYIEQLGKCVAKSQWSKASKLWREAPKMFEKILSELTKKESSSSSSIAEQPTKRRKTESRLESLMHLKPRWNKFSQSLDQFDIQLSGGSNGFAFTFIEGNIVKAVRNGDWVLLDEINLASPDTLESIADLLQSGPQNSPSILLSETGDIERVRAHPNFRIFGAMNPATDVGKRDLPMGLRSRFTEIYVESPDRNLDDLLGVIKAYLKTTSSNDERAAHDVGRLYMNTKRLADEKRLVDGANQIPHFSLRTLTRVLSYVVEIAPSYGLRRALYEGFAMGFLTLLNSESERLLMPLINHHLLDGHGNPQALLAQTPRHPDDGKQYVRFMNKKKDRQYWMRQGSEQPQEQPHYIITPFVERNMLNLVRATSTRRFPVLIQGPTSSGKTSMIEYLAKFSGNKFVRINNHEHTDLQEYLGTYVSGSDGQLRFQEGLLVQALRQGHWIVLDELNLAPTDVLEALNRLLDDNRELLITETQEIVRPHDNFMLFATQNPPGLYGGRKTLSRAFRNRFLELHFDDIPEDELDFILEKRSQKVAPSDCRRIVIVYKELSRMRQSNRLFEQKDSFATLRDLFRWALRDADNREQLAANGYMLLAERVRNPDERSAVKEIIERVMKVKLDPNVLYDATLSPEIKAYNDTPNTQGVVWTQAMRRLYVLVSQALRNNEPVLLVGETGCGKTTVCQMLADAFCKELHIVNAHQNTETGDLIGAQRPVRNRAAILDQLRKELMKVFDGLCQHAVDEDLDALVLAYKSLSASDRARVPEELRQHVELLQVKSKSLFEWSDGSLVQAMKNGQFFLLDEISLADDSVLERLNSVLESHRTILLAEKGAEDSFIQAADGFQFFATMNPGGDYGKRELSPALRNRFTEIWVPSLSEHEDVLQIVASKLRTDFKPFSNAMVYFAEWFGQTYRSSASTSISVRDVLAWVNFMNGCTSTDLYFAVLHGAAMVYIDTLGANPAALLAINPESIREERLKCLQKLSNLLGQDVGTIYFKPILLINEDQTLKIGEFSIPKQAGFHTEASFSFEAPTTKLNAMRVLRALQVQKPILIEGSPGVGKTTLIDALARSCKRPLTRINLSEQTDLMDLFGSDVPVEGAAAGHFAWRDAPFLLAMQRGEWVLLDEMNLASQSVLEGLNACLDHRGEVYISELDQTFKRHPNFSVFAAQNPHHQGGGRKGLPSSFVNRFTVVYADVFRNEDLGMICKHNFPMVSDEVIFTLISFVSQLEREIVHERRFGSQGSPWEFNLRDILRWLRLLESTAPLLAGGTSADFLNLIFRQRFRSPKDRLEVDKIFKKFFGSDVPVRHFFHNMSSTAYQVGLIYMPRDALIQRLPFPAVDPINRLPEIESVMICIQQNLPCILVGPSGSGKTTLVQHIAAAAGTSLVVFPLNADIDTMDLVGGFEQVDPQRSASSFLDELTGFLHTRALVSLPTEIPEEAIDALELLKTGDRASSSYFSDLGRYLRRLESKTSLPEFKNMANTCDSFASRHLSVEGARFEWVDGVLVKALEQGKWLVLDNANLCSASVLDRLNSLLEPNGFLSINEHCGPDGEPKIVRPHPEFRIFLTMDPRFGELSRAMRNRAVEIFLEPLLAENGLNTSISVPALKPEATMQRYQALSKALEVGSTQAHQLQLLGEVAIENMAWSDMPLLPRFAQNMQRMPIKQPNLAARLLDLSQGYLRIYETEDSRNFRLAVGDMLDKVAAKTGLPVGFRDAQIIHPLQNSPLVPVLQQSSGHKQVYWLAACFELQLGIYAAIEAHRTQAAAIESLKPSQMNRLQRSAVSGRVSTVTKDSTILVSTFLTQILKALGTYLQDHTVAAERWSYHKRVVAKILQYWWDTYHLVTGKTFEEATFQAHLAIGADLLSRVSECDPTLDEQSPLIEAFDRNLQNDFNSGFKLTTGLSMETLWKILRPNVTSNLQIMATLSQMEALAVRFDTLRWNVSISVTEIGSIIVSLVKAYRLVLVSEVDGASLVQTIGKELDTLEASMGTKEDELDPFLATQFEALRQFEALEAMRSGQSPDTVPDIDTIVLASHPTTSAMRLSSSTKTSRSLQSIDYLWGNSHALHPITGNFSSALLRKLNSVGEVDLKSLELLQSELPIMGRKLALSSGSLSRDHLLDLNNILSDLIFDVIAAHDENIEKAYKGWGSSIGALIDLQTMKVGDFKAPIEVRHDPAISPDTPRQLQEVLQANFNRALVAIAASKAQPGNRLQFSALAWVHFAIGCLTLYVPDRAYDPDKRQRLERERHEKVRAHLQNKLAAIRQFERLFSGQTSNLRCQLVEREIAELGEPGEVLQEIFRPQTSELDQLQGEFNNLLETVVRSCPHAKVVEFFANGDDGGLQEIRLLQNNTGQILRRLSERFTAYHDLTAPAISMLRCLQIGLFMVVAVKPLAKSNTSLVLSKMTPFLGGGPTEISEVTISTQPMQYLSLIATTAATENIHSFEPSLRQSLFKTFHSCYDQWTKRLESDRDDAASKTGLYRFRGSAEDEEEDDIDQFNELFPSYDDEQDYTKNGIPTPTTARDAAIRLARIHADIFLGGTTPSESLLALIRQISKQIGIVHDENNCFHRQNMTSAFLPGTLLLLDDQIEAMGSTTSASESYNFYTDPHLPETRKIVNLVHQIQVRFRQLQAVDEIGHMQPLEDVLVSCRELLQFRHTEPLAKIITKVEKIHGFMHEWQFGGWASRAYSVLTLYDNLTTTIVNWRRLELSTWAKLFSMESEKCDDDARSWWFVAYQVLVAAPLAMAESKDELRAYSQKILQDLEAYFSTAIVGQFVQRLQLLKQLQRHIELLIYDFPLMSIIHGSLANFIAIYARYEEPVTENLKKGQQALDKSMRDVLLLASWKDTNIVALRDSAKRSHHKLFKIVRKFRSLLGQPMEVILKQGLPDETVVATQESEYTAPKQYPTVDQAALARCAASVPRWSEKSKRFINVSKTISIMADASQIPDSALEGPEYLDSFVANIIASTAELQKATPSVLTEDNKVFVKHLKSRKRKLFADTLKDLRRMGIKYNLGVKAASEQNSFSIVLANTEYLPVTSGCNTQGLDYFFHKTLDMAPRAREAARQHSEDLSSTEVARSTGFLEGLLYIVLRQHNMLSVAVTNMEKLKQTINMAKGLWAPATYDIRVTKVLSTHEKLVRWLPNVLNVALELLKIHTKFGKVNSEPTQSTLSSWSGIFTGLVTRWDSLCKLPPSIISTERQCLEEFIKESVQRLVKELEEINIQQPDLSFIINQILPWTEVSSLSVTEDLVQKTVTDLDQKVSIVCDMVLVATEKHKMSIGDLPTSLEDPGWLIKNDICLANGIKSLHCSNVTTELEEAFDILRALDMEGVNVSRAAGAIFAVATPILEQYYNILQEIVTRYAQLHHAACKMFYVLAKTFTQIASQGFCTPSEKSSAEDGKTEKLEEGTGLGDGEGAEDISKDIQDDENLDELAQEPNEKGKEDIEDQEDAVDMADGDMEGEMGDVDENGEDDDKEDGEESGNEMDEEAGDVDDLDPTAVDEKMWDGDDEQVEKDQEGDDSKGKSKKEEQVAAQEASKEAGDGDETEEDDAVGAEQGEEIVQDEVEKHDPHAREGEALELPDEMEIDGDDDGGSASDSDDGINDLTDVEEDAKDGEELGKDGKEESDTEAANEVEDQHNSSDMDAIDADEDPDEDGAPTEEAGEKVESESEEQQLDNEDDLLRDRSNETAVDVDNAVPSDVQGTGEDQDESSTKNNDESTSKAQREDGENGGNSSERKEVAAEDGEKGRQVNEDAPQDSSDNTKDSSAAEPFKKLGDALELWHRQHNQIREPAEPHERQDQNMDINAERSEFQHLQDETAEADNQALGTATEEQAHAFDESMAVDSESKEMPETFQPDVVEENHNNDDDVLDDEDESISEDQRPQNAYEGRAGAMIKQGKDDRSEQLDDINSHVLDELEEDVDEVDTRLESTHLENTDVLEPRSAAEARQKWTHYEAMTRDLSLSLTEQLRLILAPRIATKMRGHFRTGKRLNIKRIIPYIASQYKRDKIWMRRSVPSKRSYQIMLAVDDSKSMGESGSGSLAFETLVLVSKSLSMLEVGEICVVSFGENFRVAHDFETPFSSDAGPKVFQNFTFEQSRTDITKLVRDSIQLFRAARAKAINSPADLWQMELIISDGVCDSSEHEPIRRLLREALEERIMMVFVIVDDLQNKKQGESVMDLKEAKFVKDEATGVSNVKIERYLDTFPFQYYLIVSDVKELPGVLATLLRQWFAEVVDSSN